MRIRSTVVSLRVAAFLESVKPTFYAPRDEPSTRPACDDCHREDGKHNSRCPRRATA